MATWGSPEYQRLTELLRTYLRPPIVAVDAAENATLTWTPVLSAAELLTYADLQAMARSSFTAAMTLAEYQAIKPFLATEAAWVAASRNTFVQTLTTDIEQRRLLFDALTAVIRVQRQQNRDG